MFISKRNIIFWLWTLFILGLSAFPGNRIPRFTFFSIDKFVHFILYAIMAYLMLWSSNNKVSKKSCFLAFLIASIYGLLIEYAQKEFFILRSFDWADAIANTIGAFCGVLFYFIFIKD